MLIYVRTNCRWPFLHCDVDGFCLKGKEPYHWTWISMQDTHVQTMRFWKQCFFPFRFLRLKILSQLAMLGYLIQLCYVSLQTPCCQGLLAALRSLHNAVTKMRRSWMIKFWPPKKPTGCWNLPFTDFTSPWPTGWDFLTTKTHSGDVSILFNCLM